jgi:hypothetical protein
MDQQHHSQMMIHRPIWVQLRREEEEEGDDDDDEEGGRPYKYHLLPEVYKANVMEPISMADYGSRGSHG